MRNYLGMANQKKPAAPNEVLKATALIYLEDALVNEEYEKCPELVAKAQYFGAGKSDIRKVIAKYVKALRFAPNYRPLRTRGRRRF